MVCIEHQVVLTPSHFRSARALGAVFLPFGHEDLLFECSLGNEHIIRSVGELEMGPAVCKGEVL